ncbi:hypothetical protein AaE_006832, partial [Aphanomyces astaci]
MRFLQHPSYYIQLSIFVKCQEKATTNLDLKSLAEEPSKNKATTRQEEAPRVPTSTTDAVHPQDTTKSHKEMADHALQSAKQATSKVDMPLDTAKRTGGPIQRSPVTEKPTQAKGKAVAVSNQSTPVGLRDVLDGGLLKIKVLI